jgi:hypothetical protein
MKSAGKPNSFRQSVTSAWPQRWPPEEWPPTKKSAGVAAESGGVFVGPCDSVAHLLRHDADIALRRADGDEIRNNKIDPGIHKEFGRKCVVLRFAAPPGAAVHEDKYEGV